MLVRPQNWLSSSVRTSERASGRQVPLQEEEELVSEGRLDVGCPRVVRWEGHPMSAADFPIGHNSPANHPTDLVQRHTSYIIYAS